MAVIIETEERIVQLTDADMELVLEVYEATKIEDGGYGLPGIIAVKGPEMAPFFPNADGKPKWTGIAPLGQSRFESGGDDAESRITARPGRKTFRHIRRECVGSLRWPKGVPVGYIDVSTQTRISLAGSSYAFSHAEADICGSEMERLYAFSELETPLTKLQRRNDEARKDAIRMHRQSPDSQAFLSLLSNAMSGLVAPGTEPAPDADSVPAVVAEMDAEFVAKQRIVRVGEARRRKWFVETRDGERVSGPFDGKEDALTEIAGL